MHYFKPFKFFILASIFILSLPVFAKKQEISLMTWNIHKAKNPKWRDLIANHSVDIFALQEAVSYRDVFEAFDPIATQYNYVYNPAWSFFEGESTGTLTASRLTLENKYPLISDDVEPISFTPKSMLVTDYRLSQCSKNLRVINVHMINFNIFGAYDNQLAQVRSYVENFKGAVVVLGDFNNWNGLRTKTMLQWTQALNLQPTDVDNKAWFNIDHVFYKGLKLLKAKALATEASDHNPILSFFSCS